MPSSFSSSSDRSTSLTSLASSSLSTAMHVFAAMTNVLMGAPNVLSMCLRRNANGQKSYQNDSLSGSSAVSHTTNSTCCYQ